MSYGTLNESTRTYIERRAKDSNIPIEKLGLEPEWQTCTTCEGEPLDECLNEACEDGSIRPEFLREITIIYGGATDEVFSLDDLYAVNIADWISEQCREQDDDEDWEIIVSIPYYEDSTTVYRVSSWDDNE